MVIFGFLVSLLELPGPIFSYWHSPVASVWLPSLSCFWPIAASLSVGEGKKIRGSERMTSLVGGMTERRQPSSLPSPPHVPLRMLTDQECCRGPARHSIGKR